MHSFFAFKDSQLKSIYEKQRIRQICNNIRLLIPFSASVLFFELVFAVFDYSSTLDFPDRGYIDLAILKPTFIILEAITLAFYLYHTQKQNQKLSDLMELLFTVIFTCSYFITNHIFLHSLSHSEDVERKILITFAVKLGAEYLWRFLFIKFICKLWISWIINLTLPFIWLFIWDIYVNKAFLIFHILFCLSVEFFLIFLAEKLKRTNFLNEQSLHTQELIYKNIFEAVPDCIFVLDDKCRIRYVNKLAHEILGEDLTCFEKIKHLKWRKNVGIKKFDITEYLGPHKRHANRKGSLATTSNVLDSVSTFADILALFKQNLFGIIGENTAVYDCKYSDEAHLQHRSFELKLSTITNQLEKFLLVTLRDTTERDMVVTLENETMVYRNNLLASVSHELRTPLNGTIAFIEQMVDCSEVSTHVKERYVIPALSSGKLLLYLILDIFDYSQLLLSHFELNIQRKRIKETLWDCMNLFEHKLYEKDINFSVEISPEISHHLHNDHQRVSQILINILSNAVKFTMSGEIILKAKLISNSTIKITVKDTGVGMDEATQRKLHYHLNSGIFKGKVSSSSAGVGLGLTISNRLAQKLGPSEENGLEFKSRLNIGSKFWFLVENRPEQVFIDDSDALLSDISEFEEDKKFSKGLSLTHLNIDKPIIPSRSRGSIYNDIGSINIEKPHVLIVDDDVFNIVALETICHSLNLKTERAFHGKEAIEKLILKNRRDCIEPGIPYKLIFMDFNMPIMDGCEATKHIKEMICNGEIENVKIIGITAYVGENDLRKCYLAGMDEVLNKPVFKKGLIEVLKRHKIIY